MGLEMLERKKEALEAYRFVIDAFNKSDNPALKEHVNLAHQAIQQLEL